jgi:hypothetical protein
MIKSAASENPGKKLSPTVRVLGCGSLLAASVVCGGLGLMLGQVVFPTSDSTPPPMWGWEMAIAVYVLGAALFTFGLALYGFIVITNCLTFDFTRPFMSSFGPKVWLANLVVGLFFQLGITGMVGALLLVPLIKLLPQAAAIPLAFLVPYFAAQGVTIWFSIVTPLDKRLTRLRLQARGISPNQLTVAKFVGVSDPAKSTLKKLTIVEEDMGALWIEERELVYRGDRDDWTISHQDLLDVERKSDAGSVSAYFGAVHVILRFRDKSGTERRLRLHPEGQWTVTGKAQALNKIGDRLRAWISKPVAGWPSLSGFPVPDIEDRPPVSHAK